MNVILSCLPLKDRLAFVYCHGHYHEMSWFLYPIFGSNELRPLDTLVKNLIIIINIIMSIITKRGANKRFLLSDDCTLLSLTSFLARFPALNSLIQRINVRKRRDSIILASVISICIILMLIYALG